MPEESSALNIEKLVALGPLAIAKAYRDILAKINAGQILTPAEVQSFTLLEKRLQGAAPEKTGPPADTTIVDHLEAVAKHFGTSLRTIQRWAKQGMPGLSGGRWDLLQIEEWRSRKKGGRGPARVDLHGQRGLVAEGDKDYQDMRAKRAMANLRELELQVRLGQVVEKRQVEEYLEKIIAAAKQELLTIPRSCPPLLVNKKEREMEAVLLKRIYAALRKLSGNLPAEVGEADAAKDPGS